VGQHQTTVISEIPVLGVETGVSLGIPVPGVEIGVNLAIPVRIIMWRGGTTTGRVD
jgi:hypothetical protein